MLKGSRAEQDDNARSEQQEQSHLEGYRVLQTNPITMIKGLSHFTGLFLCVLRYCYNIDGCLAHSFIFYVSARMDYFGNNN